MSMPFPVANAIRSLLIPAILFPFTSGHPDEKVSLYTAMLILFGASYLTNWSAYHLKAKSGARVTWIFSIYLGFQFTVLTAFFLAFLSILKGSTVSVFIALFLTFLMYFGVFLLLPSIPIFYLANRWRPEPTQAT
jgi:hypothetical protein